MCVFERVCMFGEFVWCWCWQCGAGAGGSAVLLHCRLVSGREVKERVSDTEKIMRVCGEMNE